MPQYSSNDIPKRILGIALLMPLLLAFYWSQSAAQWIFALLGVVMALEFATMLSLGKRARAVVVFSFIMFCLPGWVFEHIREIPLIGPFVDSEGFLFLLGAACAAVVYASSRMMIAVSFVVLMAFCFTATKWFLGLAHGNLAITLLVLVVTACDIAAFVGGRALGGVPLAPSISPKKTWAGAICGLVFGTLVWAFLFDGVLSISFLSAVFSGIVITVVAQTGDLVESLLKRRVGVKDSGNWIPGHGGALDRFDGYLFAAPVMYFIFLTNL